MKKNHAPATPVKAVYKPCHTDGHEVFTANNTTFYVGKYISAFNKNYDLIIDLSGLIKPPVEQYGLGQNLQAFAARKTSSILQIDWPDFSIINWTTDDYKKLLQAIADDQVKTVYICCVGGHGRTGTLTTILASLCNIVPEDACPVTWLRNKYCESVVESEEQMKYITQITGRKVTAQGSKMQSYGLPSINNNSQHNPARTGYSYVSNWEGEWQAEGYYANRDRSIYSGYFLNPND